MTYRKFNEDKFFGDLGSCKAVIANGGFTLISEAIYLKKPVLSVPVKGQFEQILNAIYLERLGYGEFHEQLSIEVLENFLKDLKKYDEALKTYNQDGNKSILGEIDRQIDIYSG